MPQNIWHNLTSWATSSFRRRTLLHEHTNTYAMQLNFNAFNTKARHETQTGAYSIRHPPPKFDCYMSLKSSSRYAYCQFPKQIPPFLPNPPQYPGDLHKSQRSMLCNVIHCPVVSSCSKTFSAICKNIYRALQPQSSAKNHFLLSGLRNLVMPVLRRTSFLPLSRRRRIHWPLRTLVILLIGRTRRKSRSFEGGGVSRVPRTQKKVAKYSSMRTQTWKIEKEENGILLEKDQP